MDKREEEIYYCFRCGSKSEKGLDNEMAECHECGEHAVISVLMAFDIINSLYLRGGLNLNYEENEYEEICYDPGDS